MSDGRFRAGWLTLTARLLDSFHSREGIRRVGFRNWQMMNAHSQELLLGTQSLLENKTI